MDKVGDMEPFFLDPLPADTPSCRWEDPGDIWCSRFEMRMIPGSRVTWVPSREHLVMLVLQGEGLGGLGQGHAKKAAGRVRGCLEKGSLSAHPSREGGDCQRVS